MPTPYKIEIFDHSIEYKDHKPIGDQTFYFDYLTLKKTSITVPKFNIKKSDYVHVTDFRGNVKFQGIADDVATNKSICDISVAPLLSLFDVNVVFDRTYLATGTLEQFIADIITDTFISNADTLQNIPGLSVSVTSSTYGASLDLDSNVGELYSIITSALSAHGVLVSVVLDPQEKEINVTVGKVSADSVVIEADLDNVIDRNFVIGDSTAGVNKLTLINQDDETESVTYYLHADGTVSTTDEDRVTPVFADVAYITGKEFAEKAEGRAVKVLTPQQYNNLIELLYVKSDRLLDVDSLGIGAPAQVLSEGNSYYSILTGYESSEDTKKLIFGVVRVELTDKLMLEKRTTSMRTYAAGATYGPESSIDGNIAVFDGEDGKTLKDSGINPAIGTFEPAIGGTEGNGNISHSYQYGWYSKLGHIVQATIRIGWDGVTAYPSGDLLINGLPSIILASDGNYRANGALTFRGLTIGSADYAECYAYSGDDFLKIIGSVDGSNYITLQGNSIGTYGWILATITYLTDD